jgi:hypothetical protein
MNEKRVDSDKNLYRRGFGPPDKKFLNPDGSATSRLFKLRTKDEGKLSVDVKELTSKQISVNDVNKFVLFEISVKSVEETDLSAYHDPLTEQEHGIENPAHAYIWGLDMDDDIKPGLLARASKRIWFN